MSPVTVGLIGILILIILLLLRMPVGFVMGLVGFAGFACLVHLNGALGLLRTVPYTTGTWYTLSILPLFLLMGEFAFRSGLSETLFYTGNKWLGHQPGGLAMGTIAACTGFAAVCGSTIATAATMGTIALPEMDKFKYDRALSSGAIAAGGTLGILIPPSSILIIYGILTEESIGKLFIAGIFPGLMLAILFIAVVYLQVRRHPEMAPPGPKTSLLEKLLSLKDTWGALLLFLLVMGGLYTGVFTPTEAGGIGAFGAFVFALAKRGLTRKSFADALMSAIKTTAMAFIILIGAMIFGYFLAVSRVPSGLAGFVSGLPIPAPLIIVLICFIYLILGCFIDSLPMVVLTVPIFYPVVVALGYDPIWFGVVIVLVTEMGCITPPVGINVYVLSGVARDLPLSVIFRGILPFLLMMLFAITILIIFPQVALFLPNLMMG